MSTSKTYEIDELANMTPAMGKNRYQALKLDIQSNGQKHPILLRNDKIIDGRHRYKACKELGITPIVNELGNISNEETINIIASYTQGKASTPTQLAAEALKHYYALKSMSKKITIDDVATKFGVGSKTLKRLNYCYKENKEYLEAFLDGDGIEIYSEKYNKKIVCKEIYGLEQTLRYNEKTKPTRVIQAEESTTSYEYDVNIEFQTEEAKDFFWKKYHSIRFGISKEDVLCQDFIEFSNFKYPMSNINLTSNTSVNYDDE